MDNDDPLHETGLLATERPGDNAPALSVSELSMRLKRTVEDAFGYVRVRGEISGWKRAASGHCYLCLKDEKAVIDGVLWKATAAGLAFRPEDGIEVVATGKLTTYPGRSRYQIVIERLELAGQGALMALLDKRRRALAAEGLFDPERKKKLPFQPRVIGVVTSPTGAVIRDILHRLADRCPCHVIVWPVQVQGEGAAGADRRGGARLQRPAGGRPGRPARPAHRRPRRRLDRGSVGVQRGGGGPRRRRLGHPDHLRRRPRDRHLLVRLRRRRSRADPDRGGRDGGAGARRPARPASRARLPDRALRPPRRRAGRRAARVEPSPLARARGPARAAAAAARRPCRPASARPEDRAQPRPGGARTVGRGACGRGS